MESISVQPNLPEDEFRQKVADCALHICQGGINQTLENHMAGIPYVVATRQLHAANNEQGYRAERFAEFSRSALLDMKDWGNPRVLAYKIEQAWRRRDLPEAELGFGGEYAIAREIASMLTTAPEAVYTRQRDGV